VATAQQASFLRSKWFLGALVAVVLVGLYALLGFYLAPRLVRSQAIEFVQENYGRELQVGEVRVNPFKLQLEIRDVVLPDTDRQAMLGFRRLFIDFEIASLWNRAFTFKRVDLESPLLRAVIRPDGAANLADLALPDEPDEPEEPESPLPDIWLQSFAISDGLVDFVDQARARVYEHRFAPITFSLSDFRTSPDGGDFALSAAGQHVERVEWQGHFALAPQVASRGQFSLTNLRAERVAELLGDALPFGLTGGLVNLAGSYDFATGEALKLQAELPRIEGSGLALRARGADTDWVTVPKLALTDTRIALPDQTVAIANIALTGMTALAWQNADGTINVSELFAPTPAAADAGPSVQTASVTTATAASDAPAAPAATADAEKPWQVAVASVDVRDAKIDFEDRALQPAVRFAIAPLNVGVQDVTLDLARALPISFDAQVNGTARVAGKGTLTPDPMVADIDLTLDGFELRDLQPYVAASTDMTIKRGTLGMAGKLGLAPPGGTAPEFIFEGDVRVAGFHSIDNALEQDFFLFERVELGKLRYTMLPDSLSVDRVRVVKPFNRVIIGSNQILNVSAVFDPLGTAAAVQANAAAAAAKAAPVRKKSKAEMRAEKKAADAAAKARAAALPAPAPELKETGMPIRIRELRVEGGRMDFADYSIQPNFAANVTGLNGSVKGMSSDPKARAKVDLKGNVGEFSPVTIAGDVQPFAFDRHTDIGLKFENISLPIFNPYSGKFAGYNISKGKLTTDLHYTITDRKLDAKHNIRIDQLEWGEATAEKGEATLPVKFATSLLKDADGVISLDVPVNGTLDDPKFRIGPLVWQIIRNILTKAVTAPFRALGALFKDAEEAQFVDFAPGQATLEAAARERLTGLGKALAPKTDIRLSVPIGGDAALDQAALLTQRYEAELESAIAATLRGGKKAAVADKPAPAFETLEPDKQIAALTALVERLAGTPPQIPAPAAPPEGTSRKEAKVLAQAAAIEYLQQEARTRVTPAQADLDALGTQRAEAIQQALLLDTGLDPQRVFLVKGGKVTPQEGKVRFELAME